MKTFLLFWTPEKQWLKLDSLARRIEDGMCGEYSYIQPWPLTNNNDINEGDRFFIICTKGNWPKGNSIYDYLRSTRDCYMGICPYASKFYNLDGVCFGGIFKSAPYEDEETDNNMVIDLSLEFAVLPGLFPIIHLNRLKKEIPNFDWAKTEGEFLIEGEEEKSFSGIISKWMMSSNMQVSDFTNFTGRNLHRAHDNLFKKS